MTLGIAPNGVLGTSGQNKWRASHHLVLSTRKNKVEN